MLFYYQLPFYTFSDSTWKVKVNFFANVNKIATEFEFMLIVSPISLPIDNKNDDKLKRQTNSNVYIESNQDIPENILQDFITKLPGYNLNARLYKMKKSYINIKKKYTLDSFNKLNKKGFTHYDVYQNYFGEIVRFVNCDSTENENDFITSTYLFNYIVKNVNFLDRNSLCLNHYKIDAEKKLVYEFKFPPTISSITYFDLPENCKIINSDTFVYQFGSLIYWIILKPQNKIKTGEYLNLVIKSKYNKLTENDTTKYTFQLLYPFFHFKYNLDQIKIETDYIFAEDSFSYMFIGEINDQLLK